MRKVYMFDVTDGDNEFEKYLMNNVKNGTVKAVNITNEVVDIMNNSYNFLRLKHNVNELFAKENLL